MPPSKKKALPEEPVEFKAIMDSLLQAAQKRQPNGQESRNHQAVHEPPLSARNSVLSRSSSKLLEN